MTCSTRCRVALHRLGAGALPPALVRADRWIRYTERKVPLDARTGRAASSTDSSTWSPYAVAARSEHGVGIGFCLGDGFAAIDLDHCLVDGRPTDAALAFLADYPEHYVEVSPSGEGLHILGYAPEAPGTRRREHGLAVERYSRERYVTVTGTIYQRGDLLPL